MGPCDQCSWLTDQLYRANGRYVSLILQHERARRGDKTKVEAEMLAQKIEGAKHTRAWVTHALVSHCAGHYPVRRPDTTVTERFSDGTALGKSFGVEIPPDL